MPSEARQTRGKTRSKSRAVRGVRSRVAVCDTGCSRENPSSGSQPAAATPGGDASVAAMPEPEKQAALRDLLTEKRQCLGHLWTRKRFWLLMAFLWGLPMLFYYLSTGYADSFSPNDVLWNKEDTNGHSLEEKSALKSVLSFFFPTTCIIREKQEIKACNELQDLNETECLRFKCCFSPYGTRLSCFTPLRDKPSQMLRMFGISVISMVILGCLFLYCCSLCQRSKWGNPLRRKDNKILKDLKKQKKKLKKEAEILGTSVDDEESDIMEQEAKAYSR